MYQALEVKGLALAFVSSHTPGLPREPVNVRANQVKYSQPDVARQRAWQAAALFSVEGFTPGMLFGGLHQHQHEHSSTRPKH